MLSHPLLTRAIKWSSRRKQKEKNTEKNPHANPHAGPHEKPLASPPAIDINARAIRYDMVAGLLNLSGDFLRIRKTARDNKYSTETAAKKGTDPSPSLKYAA